MSETPIEYDKMIWEVFAIGVTASVIILYFVIKTESEIPNEYFKLSALILGFSILLYSTFLFGGYNFKKIVMYELIKNPKEKNHSIERRMVMKLDEKCYPRTKYMAELILVGIIAGYFYSFYYISQEVTFLFFPIIILAAFIILCLWSNCRDKN